MTLRFAERYGVRQGVRSDVLRKTSRFPGNAARSVVTQPFPRDSENRDPPQIVGLIHYADLMAPKPFRCGSALR